MTIKIVEAYLKRLEKIRRAKQVVKCTIDILVSDQDIFSTIIDNSKYIDPLREKFKQLEESEQQTRALLNKYGVNVDPEEKNHLKMQELQVIAIGTNSGQQGTATSGPGKVVNQLFQNEPIGGKKVVKEDNNKPVIVKKEKEVKEEKKQLTSLSVESSQGKKILPDHSFSINNCNSTNNLQPSKQPIMKK